MGLNLCTRLKIVKKNMSIKTPGIIQVKYLPLIVIYKMTYNQILLGVHIRLHSFNCFNSERAF